MRPVARRLRDLLLDACGIEHKHPDFPPVNDDSEDVGQRLFQDLEPLYRLLGIDGSSSTIFPDLPTILCTSRLHCVFCTDTIHPRTLRRFKKPFSVRLLDHHFEWKAATLFVAYCIKCKAEYYPDRITYRPPGTSFERQQRLEIDASVLCVSKHGVWIDWRVADTQEKALHRFRSGWSAFAAWLNDFIDVKPHVTVRQAQRLHQEHFSRRLLAAHGIGETFSVAAHSNANTLAAGANGGVIAGAMSHGCRNCTHLKRYASDFMPEERGQLSQNENEVICTVKPCRKPLVDYQKGCFCKEHLPLADVCGIVPYGRPVVPGAVTCDRPAHVKWHRKYQSRFRVNFSGIQRVIRRQSERSGTESANQPSIPTPHPDLPELDSVLGADAMHNFPTDLLCRVWCNPAPSNGSQPVLVEIVVDDDGRRHTACAFNTETAEQLNAWLNGYEAQLRQMTDVNYDFYVHVLMLLYKEEVERKIEKKGNGLDDEFWAQVNSTN
uniref:CxC5 like cysteine cluster associated with KDZ domain-containing protein n=1 Tax=Mycena chlorophos TaxID=658473 RepID=A0ABQ0LBL7_MYCCL|nr:predicted protein [Mycena chlorophos]